MKEKVTSILIACVITLGAYATDVKTVGIGAGANKEIATQTALRNALENVYGVYITSTTTMSNDKILADKISAITFGKIVTYKVIDSTTDVSGGITVTIDATVSLDKLSTFVGENTGTSIKFDGAGWGMQQKMERLNKENEEKAAKNIVNAILALDVDLTNKIEVSKIMHHATSEIDYDKREGSYDYKNDCRRDRCIKICVKYDKKWKHNANRETLIQLIDNAFEALKNPETKKFRSEFTKICYNGLMSYVENRSFAFAITDGTGTIYPIFFMPKHINWHKNYFKDYEQTSDKHHIIFYNRELGFHWYCRDDPRTIFDCDYVSGYCIKRDGKLVINIFYTSEQLEKVTEFTVIPLPQQTIDRLKDYYLDYCFNDETIWSNKTN